MNKMRYRQPKEAPLWYNTEHYPFRTLGQLEKVGKLTLGRERSYIDNGKVRTLIDARVAVTAYDVTLVFWEHGEIRYFLASWRDNGCPPWAVQVTRVGAPPQSLTLRRLS